MKEIDGKVQENVEITRKPVEGSTPPGDGRSDGAASISSGGARDMSEFSETDSESLCMQSCVEKRICGGARKGTG
jgi:hypothetical protein